MDETELELGDILNAQTGRIAWPELARHFARGVVLWVAPGEDLVAVAKAMIEDQVDVIQALRDSEHLRAASDDDARRWASGATELWAVVVAPWVLVQDTRAE